MATEPQQINLNEYTAKKASGKMTLVKIGDATCLLSRQMYNPETGEPGVPAMTQLNLGSIQEMREKMIADKAGIDAVLLQLTALETDMKAALGL